MGKYNIIFERKSLQEIVRLIERPHINIIEKVLGCRR
jgi:hypothetical protein